MKGLVYVPPHLSNLEEPIQRITTALHTDTQDIMQRVWEELVYRFEACRVSDGAHIEYLRNRYTNIQTADLYIDLYSNSGCHN